MSTILPAMRTKFITSMRDRYFRIMEEEEKIDMGRLNNESVVFVVDDQAMNVEVLEMLLEKKLGRTCISAYSGHEAIQKTTSLLRKGQTKRVLFLMDVNMPVMDGSEATTKLRLLLSQYRNV